MVEIRRKRALDRRSLWLLSREAWGRFLWRNLHFELRDDDERPDLGDDWPLVYNEHRIDPWDEMNALELEIRRDHERRRKFSGTEKVHFEPGSWTPAASEDTSWTAGWVVPAEFQIRRLGDLVGVPWRASTTDMLPEPRPGMAREAFAKDVIDPLLAGDVLTGSLESLAYMGSSADKGRGVRLFDPETAARLVASIPWSEAIDRDLASRAISFGLLPIAPIDDALADLLWDRSASTGVDGRVLLLPYVARHDSTRRDEAAAGIEHALGTTEFRPVNSALEAVRIWARLADRADFPTRLTKTVVTLVAVRREPGLFRALDVCVDLVAAGLLTAEDVRRVIDSLGYLLTETEYEGWRTRDFRTATLTFVRANGVRLARALAQAGHEDAVIDRWIAVAASDAAPEVRFVTDGHD